MVGQAVVDELATYDMSTYSTAFQSAVDDRMGSGIYTMTVTSVSSATVSQALPTASGEECTISTSLGTWILDLKKSDTRRGSSNSKSNSEICDQHSSPRHCSARQ